MGDRGAIGAYVVVVFAAVVLIVGLIVDGGAVRAGRREAGDVAARAARAGAQEIDIDLLMATGDVALEELLAAEAARRFLESAGWSGAVAVGRDRVTVSVRATVPMQFLGVIGVGARSVTATRTARAAEGVSEG